NERNKAEQERAAGVNEDEIWDPEVEESEGGEETGKEGSMDIDAEGSDKDKGGSDKSDEEGSDGSNTEESEESDEGTGEGTGEGISGEQGESDPAISTVNERINDNQEVQGPIAGDVGSMGQNEGTTEMSTETEVGIESVEGDQHPALWPEGTNYPSPSRDQDYTIGPSDPMHTFTIMESTYTSWQQSLRMLWGLSEHSWARCDQIELKQRQELLPAMLRDVMDLLAHTTGAEIYVTGVMVTGENSTNF
ncbi:hypothetical protein FRC11_010275, partial [Ceratobasidium sp. 423]